MSSAAYEPSYLLGISPRRRAAALFLAAVANLLLLLMLLGLVPALQPPPPKSMPKSFTLAPERNPQAGSRTVARVRRESGGSAAPQVARARPTPPTPTPPVPPPLWPPEMLVITREDYAASDISKLPSRKGASDGAGEGSGRGSDSGDSASAGTGPGGEQLYQAEWYREPSDSQISPYVPANPPEYGWGEVACRTIERYHVEDCQELGSSPMGSGLGRTVREAAWQFLVRPPRVGGRSMVGSWVRIRITFSPRGVRGR